MGRVKSLLSKNNNNASSFTTLDTKIYESSLEQINYAINSPNITPKRKRIDITNMKNAIRIMISDMLQISGDELDTFINLLVDANIKYGNSIRKAPYKGGKTNKQCYNRKKTNSRKTKKRITIKRTNIKNKVD